MSAYFSSPVQEKKLSDRAENNSSKLTYEQQKEQQKQIRRLEKSVTDCENRIENLEAEIAALEERMTTPEGASDMKLYEEHTALKKQLDAVVEEWEKVSMELEEMKNE